MVAGKEGMVTHNVEGAGRPSCEIAQFSASKRKHQVRGRKFREKGEAPRLNSLQGTCGWGEKANQKAVGGPLELVLTNSKKKKTLPLEKTC